MFERPMLWREVQLITKVTLLCSEDMSIFVCLFAAASIFKQQNQEKRGQVVHEVSFPKADLATGICSV